jgi:hypothetical protein
MTVKPASPESAGRPSWSASTGSPRRPKDAIQCAVFDHIRVGGACVATSSRTSPDMDRGAFACAGWRANWPFHSIRLRR